VNAPSVDEAVTVLYRLASKAAHPDTGGDARTMAKVNAAVETLRGRPPIAMRTAEPCRRPHLVRPYADTIMPWGKHRGESMSEVPLGYLGWIVENVDNDEDVRDVARTWLHWRTRS
jgi:hypothetical protein